VYISIIGAVKPTATEHLACVPFWMFQEDESSIITASEIESWVEKVEACGANAKYTSCSSENGDILLHISFENPEIYAWLLRQSQKSAASSAKYWTLY